MIMDSMDMFEKKPLHFWIITFFMEDRK